MSRTIRAIRKQLRKRQDLQPWVGLIGDAQGTVEVPGQPNLWYVRPKGTDLPLIVRGGGAPRVAGTEVLVGRDPYRRNLTRVLGLHYSEGSTASEAQAVEAHAPSHGPDGSDIVYLATWQITNGLVYVASGMTAGVHAGWIVVDGKPVKAAAASIDLTSHIPATGARFALIRADSSGAVSVQDGTPVASLADLTPADAPEAPEGYAPLALARLYAGQTGLSRMTTAPDLIDVRFAPRTRVAGVGAAEDVSVDASGFSGNLSGTDTDVQTALETIDALTIGGSITVEEQDGTPSVSGVTTIKVPNGALTDDGGGVVSINTLLGSADPHWYVDGALATGANASGAWIAPRATQIEAVFITCKTLGSASSTIVDVNKNGTTIFSTQANRPTLAYNDADSIAKGVPDITTLDEGDRLTIDIDQIATGAEGLSVVVALKGNAGTANALTLIGEVSSSGSAAYLEITSIPNTYKNLIIDFIGRSSKVSVNNDTISLTLNGDTTDANYRRQTYYNLSGGAGADGRVLGTIQGATASADQFATYRVTILNYAGGFHKTADWWGDERRDGTEHYRWWGFLFWENTAAITSIRIGTASDNLVSGSILRVWGEG